MAVTGVTRSTMPSGEQMSRMEVSPEPTATAAVGETPQLSQNNGPVFDESGLAVGRLGANTGETGKAWAMSDESVIRPPVLRVLVRSLF